MKPKISKTKIKWNSIKVLSDVPWALAKLECMFNVFIYFYKLLKVLCFSFFLRVV